MTPHAHWRLLTRLLGQHSATVRRAFTSLEISLRAAPSRPAAIQALARNST
ncbi:hypothetical protein AB0D92_29955 [Streptomyces parvus]|uniref:hypothetical protein n=1 Tax=Streptomyces parvus TaxID=66428 RepID=UPI0033D7EE53